MGSELLQVIESIRGQEATVDRIFRRETAEGHVPVSAGRRHADPAYPARLAEFATFLGEVISGHKDPYYLREAMGISDFPLMMGDVLERTLLANYREWPATYQNYVAAKDVRDFREVKEFTLEGAEKPLEVVPPQTEYPERAPVEGSYAWSVQKRGARMPFSWELIVNDDLDALTDIPQRFGRAARRSEEFFATELFVDANGPHASFYSAGNKNIVNIANGASANNPALSISALQDALTVLYKQTDADGEPIMIDAIELVVPPALKVTADQIVNTTEYRVVVGGNTQIIRGNGLGGQLRVSTNPYIPFVATAANGSRSWFLFANPALSRPALRVGFLRGRREPEIWLKSPNAQRVGGGAVSPMEGDFDTDSIQYRVRHIFGGRRLDPKATVASNGSGA